MAPQPYAVSVYRAGAWVQVQTTELLPGDLCSIGTSSGSAARFVVRVLTGAGPGRRLADPSCLAERSQDDRTVPCDLVLVQGSCIVNEAMLTGESTPQLKESVADRDANDTLDIIAKDRNYVLFAGTKIVQSTFVPNDANRIPPRTVPARRDGGVDSSRVFNRCFPWRLQRPRTCSAKRRRGGLRAAHWLRHVAGPSV